MITRRQLIIASSVAVFAAPLCLYAQSQGKVSRIGFLGTRSRPSSLESDTYGAVLIGLRELGYVEGKNLLVEWRFADSKVDRLLGFAEEFVRLKVDTIVAPGTQATIAAQKATSTIPIVTINPGDPVAMGFARSLARPGGNITGITTFLQDFSTKHLEMLLSMVPKLLRVAVLLDKHRTVNLDNVLKNIQAASASIKANVNILPIDAGDSQEIEAAFSTMVREKARAVIVVQSPLFLQQRNQIAELATRNRLPSVTSYREFTEAGCLMSYGQNNFDSYRRAATYVDKILKGAKPADLPIEQPTTFELIINGKTAKTLGLTIPPSLLVSANKVIE